MSERKRRKIKIKIVYLKITLCSVFAFICFGLHGSKLCSSDFNNNTNTYFQNQLNIVEISIDYCSTSLA